VSFSDTARFCGPSHKLRPDLFGKHPAIEWLQPDAYDIARRNLKRLPKAGPTWRAFPVKAVKAEVAKTEKICPYCSESMLQPGQRKCAACKAKTRAEQNKRAYQAIKKRKVAV
jgi:hypothetical protein